MSRDKLIFKNTLLVAVRMPLALTIGLYTSRVVLQQLGVVDFGVYSVIAGLVLMMGFFNAAMSTSIQRFMNIEIARHGDIQKVFAIGFRCVIIVAACFLLLGELVGPWSVVHLLDIPADRTSDAHIVLQLSLLTVIIEMFRQPYIGVMVAHEKMSAYAWLSIFEAFLKMILACLLTFLPGNKLIIYVLLLVGTAIAINIFWARMVRNNFSQLRFSLKAKSEDVKEMSRFIGWNTLTTVSDLCYQQGASVVLNMFYGVTLNATMGIANQVKQAVTSFSRSVQVASNPQIIQNFAAGRQEDFEILLGRISRICAFVTIFMGLPIMLNSEFLLSHWLTILPPQVILFVKCMLIFCLVDSFTGPLWVTMQASGKLKYYQIIISVIWILYLPVAWAAFKLGAPAAWIIILQIAINIPVIAVRLWFSHRHCNISVGRYITRVLWPVLKVIVLAALPAWAVSITMDNLTVRFFIGSTVACLLVAAAIFTVGITRQERTAVVNAIKARLKR